jgi:hypothetical protein
MDMLDMLDLDLTEPVKLAPPRAIIEEQDDPNDDFKLITSDGKYTTGWCQSGGHEGHPKLSSRGSKMVACRGRYEFPRLVKPVFICNCWCHEVFAKVRAMEAAAIADGTNATNHAETAVSGDAGPVKIHVSTPIPTADPGWFPAPQPLTQNLYERLYDDPFLTDNLAGMLAKYCKVAPHTVQRERRAGRRERGSLDVNVETVCRLIADKMIPFPGNPQVIAMLIDPDEGISSGAVYACLTRFMSEGLIERVSPVVFAGFVGDAIEMTIKEARRKIEKAAKRIGR